MAATSPGDRTRRMPPIAALTNGTYAHEPLWYRNFLYREEAARGLDCIEDLASPGTFMFDLRKRDAIIVLRADDRIDDDAQARVQAHPRRRGRPPRTSLAARSRRRRLRGAPRRGLTIIAGFPWFTDWGRDTFIAMRGLVIARGRLRRRRVDPPRLGGHDIRRHAAQSLSRSRRDAGIQFGRRIALVCDRRPRFSGCGAAGRRGSRSPAATR